ncbi:MAG TPA: hypothetical protein DCM87_19750 [Planctomycetes bacterium]|nr:hypothetical protein [Planctomycetota bacterium]
MSAAAVLLTFACAAPADLTFAPAAPGYFTFDTGALRGTIRADGTSEGVVKLTDAATGAELANDPPLPGILSLYRVFAGPTRFPDARSAPHRAQLNAQKTELAIVWEAAPERPYEIAGRFTLGDARSLDLALECTAKAPLPAFEVFVSSYPAMALRHFLFVKDTLHQGGRPDPVLYEPLAAPFLEGCYLAFPRDNAATRLLFDGRWERPPNPVHFAAGRHYAAPLLGSRNPESGVSVLLFARPEDCFALESTYTRPGGHDSVASHNSLYLSLGGKDLATGETARFRLRATVAALASHREALDLYARWRDGGAAKE